MNILKEELTLSIIYIGKWEIEALTTDGAIEEDTGLVLTVG